MLFDPRVNPREFDVVVPPIHDGLEGANVMPIVGACHRITPQRMDEAVNDYTSVALGMKVHQVPIPPGCPVPQAFRRSSASAPRTSPIGRPSSCAALWLTACW